MVYPTTCPTQCPSCGARNNYVSSTLPMDKITSRRGRGFLQWRREMLSALGVVARRRQCRDCRHSWLTLELNVEELADLHLMAKGDVRVYAQDEEAADAEEPVAEELTDAA